MSRLTLWPPMSAGTGPLYPDISNQMAPTTLVADLSASVSSASVSASFWSTNAMSSAAARLKFRQRQRHSRRGAAAR